MPTNSFSVGLFKFSQEEEADHLWNVYYGGQERLVTEVHLEQPGKVKDEEYRCIRDTFILQINEQMAKYHYELLSADGISLAGFTTHAAITLSNNVLHGLDSSEFKLSLNGSVLGGILLPDYIGLNCRNRVRENAFISSLLSNDVLTKNAATWRAPIREEILHITGTHSLTGITHDYAANIIGITPSNYRKYIASDSAKNRATISFSAWHYLLNRLEVTGA